MQRDWNIIKDILSSKDNSTSLKNITSDNFSAYKYHIDKLIKEGFLAVKGSVCIKSVPELNDGFKHNTFLTKEGYDLLDCIYSDVFKDVVTAIEKQKAYGPLSLVIELTVLALKKKVMDDLGLK